MARRRRPWPLIVLLVLIPFSIGHASSTKLDPRARTALQKLRTGGRAVVEEMVANRMAVNRSGELDVIIRGDVSRGELEAAGARVRTARDGFFTAYVPVEAIERVADLAGVARISGSVPVELELDVSVPTTGANLLRGPGPDFSGLNGAGVLIGDVDTGVDYGHPDFFDEAGAATRLISIWDQTDPAGPTPAAFAYGTEWSAAQITSGASLETDLDGHGTHVLGIAGGDGSGTGGTGFAYQFAGMAPRADLCMVKTDFSTAGIVDGVGYVFDRATARGQSAVCNLSLGSQFGPHDGTSDFEALLTALTGPGRIIVKSAGNDRGVARHAEIQAAGSGSVITMTVTGSAAARVIAIDGYYNGTENLTVRITTPETAGGGPDSTVITVPLGGANAVYPGAATTDGTVYVENGLTSVGGSREVYIEINVAAGQNMNGTWKLTFIPVALGAANGEVDLWRFFSTAGVAANFATGNAPNEELISEPGNAVGLITVAADVSKQNWIACTGALATFTGTPAVGNLAQFSSPGPTRDGRQKPEITAPGLAIGSTRTLDVAQACPAPGTPSTLLPDDLMHIMNAGTSMAAPHVTGAVALLLQKRGALDVAQVRSYLQTHATTDGFTGAAWNRDWGFGKLNLGDLVDPSMTVTSPNGGESYQAGVDVVNLTWSASDALGSVAAVDLRLSRSGPGGPFEDIALALPNTGAYSWNVTGPPTTSAFLQAIAHDTNQNTGSDLSNAAFEIRGAVGVEDLGVSDFELAPVSPNPARERALFQFALPHAARVRLTVVDVQGRVVARVVDGIHPAGRFRAEWDGARSGRRAPAGLYFARYDVPGARFIRRLVLTR